MARTPMFYCSAAFTSMATLHGGQETTLFSILTDLLHFGMTVIGLDYGFKGQIGIDEIRVGSPYGATMIAGGDGLSEVHEEGKDAARPFGRRVAATTARLAN